MTTKSSQVHTYLKKINKCSCAYLEIAHVRRNRRLEQRILALRAGDGAVVTDSPNMARILANYYASFSRTDEGRDHSSQPEPSPITNAPRFTSAAVHKKLSPLDTA